MSAPDFTRMVPGFDFLQSLLKGAGSSLPGMGQWIAPTLDAEEVDKRIQELRTVQYWLEQNARMLGATIQALEVQRMTLATLKTMNLPMSELRDSMKLDPGRFASDPSTTRPPSPAPAPATAEEPRARSRKPAGRAEPAQSATAPSMVDPMQWWGALTQQFTELATNAMKDAQAAATAVAPAAAAASAEPAAAAATSKTAQAAKSGKARRGSSGRRGG